MEEDDEIEAQTSNKFPRVGNGRNETSNKVGSSRGVGSEQYQEEEEDGEVVRRGVGVVVGGGGSDGSTNHFQSSWHHSSRIIRVSRASGGKDRHSKVMTSKGLRDRRVRLSVTTAIQFYDLQDRLGYDQPSKAVEWLIKAAQDAISELPSLNTPFPDTPKQLSDEKRPSGQRTGQQPQGFDDADEDNLSYQQNQSQNLSLSKSACSSTSETSKGSGLSLSRSEIRVNREKARERARERAAKDKEKDNSKENESNIAASHHHHHHDVNNNHNHNHMSHTASFTELLTGGIGSTVTVNPTTPNGSSLHHIHHPQHQHHDEANLFNKGGAATRQQHWSSTVTPMDYFTSGLLVGPSPSVRTTTQQQHRSSSSGFQLGHALPISPFSGENVNHSDQMQHFSFMPDHLSNMHHHQTVVTSSSAAVSASHSSGGDNNLNFSISSSGLGGYNRGTLQSNSPSFLPHLHQRFQPLDGSSNLPFFTGAPPAPNSSASASAAPNMDDNNNNNNHHHHLQFSPVFDGRLQLCYGDGTRHSDHKGKGKN